MVPLHPQGRTHSSLGASSPEARQTQQVRVSSTGRDGMGGILAPTGADMISVKDEMRGQVRVFALST